MTEENRRIDRRKGPRRGDDVARIEREYIHEYAASREDLQELKDEFRERNIVMAAAMSKASDAWHRIDAHEQVCQQRQIAIMEKLTEMKRVMWAGIGLLITVRVIDMLMGGGFPGGA